MTDLTDGPDRPTYEQKFDQLNRCEEARGQHAALPPVERHFSYEIETRRRKHNWSVERSGLIGRAIDRFCDPKDAEYHFQDRDVFFAIERDDRQIAAGTLTIWRGVYDDDGGGWDLEGFVRRGDMNSRSEYDTAVAVAKVWAPMTKAIGGLTTRFATVISAASVGW